MKIAVIWANGKAGHLLVKEAQERGFETTAIVRSADMSWANFTIQKDIFSLISSDLKGFDVVISAVRASDILDFSLQKKQFSIW